MIQFVQLTLESVEAGRMAEFDWQLMTQVTLNDTPVAVTPCCFVREAPYTKVGLQLNFESNKMCGLKMDEMIRKSKLRPHPFSS